MEWVLGVVTVALIVCIYASVNLLRKIERVDEELTDVSLTLADVLISIEQAYVNMQTIDSRGLFESEDETGAVFKDLKQEIDMLRSKYIKESPDAK